MSAVYEINKGIGQSIEFKGIKAQYLIYLAAGMVTLLLLFFGCYAIGINIYVCIAFILPAGVGLILITQHLSKKFGANGLEKLLSSKRLPTAITTHTRKPFINLHAGEYEKNKKDR